ncbi:hypothetical protein Aph02nite_75910 [Actinoplanes philippinensis]|nr:hypothetical protein Aph02nite_75910 [Actinoplanes philippinensis]
MPGDVRRPHVTEILDTLGGQRFGVAVQVAPIGRERVAGQAALDREVVQIALDRPVQAQRSTSVNGIEGSPCASATGP